MCEEAVIYTSVCAEAIDFINEDAHDLRDMYAYVCEDGRLEFKYAVHKGDGSIIRGVVRVFFAGLVYECCSASAPGCGGVAQRGHNGK